MTKSECKCKVDSVTIGELVVNMLGPTPTVVIKYALANAESGEKFGAGLRAQGWSDDSLQILQTLIASLERDICSGLFEGDTSGSVLSNVADTMDSVPGF